jgi:CBS domain-containing protein
MQVQGILAVKGSDVATVEPGASVRDAVAQLRDRGVGALVVSADGRSIDGIVSERDVVRRLADGPEVLDVEVRAVMTADVYTCGPTDTVDALMALMTEHRIRHVPVVDDARHLVGIISIGDVVKQRLGDLEGENRALVEYIQHGR